MSHDADKRDEVIRQLRQSADKLGAFIDRYCTRLWRRDVAEDGTSKYRMCETIDEWAMWRRVADAADLRRIDWTEDDGGRYTVSTVFLGTDHATGDGPPVLWETTVFRGRGIGEVEQMRRYTSEADARAGHAEYIAWAESQRWDDP